MSNITVQRRPVSPALDPHPVPYYSRPVQAYEWFLLVFFALITAVVLFYGITAFSWEVKADIGAVQFFNSVMFFLPDTFIVDCSNPLGLSDAQQLACVNEFGSDPYISKEFTWPLVAN